jgi:hypothetical protein
MNRNFLATLTTLLMLSSVSLAAGEPDSTPSGSDVVAVGCTECNIKATSVSIQPPPKADRWDSYLPNGGAPASGSGSDTNPGKTTDTAQ